MTMRRRIERLEQQARKQAEELRKPISIVDMSDEELLFFICLHYCVKDLDYMPRMRQFTENGLRVTILLEPAE